LFDTNIKFTCNWSVIFDIYPHRRKVKNIYRMNKQGGLRRSFISSDITSCNPMKAKQSFDYTALYPRRYLSKIKHLCGILTLAKLYFLLNILKNVHASTTYIHPCSEHVFTPLKSLHTMLFTACCETAVTLSLFDCIGS
jgi:hypothetical protein